MVGATVPADQPARGEGDPRPPAEIPVTSRLTLAARLLRLAHGAVAALGLASLATLWGCALTRRRGWPLHAAMAWLGVQGIAIVVGRGNCPLGPLQRTLGDPTPLFELMLPPGAAKRAFPVLFAATAAGVVGMWLRPPITESGGRLSAKAG